MQKVKNEILENRDINKIKEKIKEALNSFLLEYNLQDMRNEAQNIYSAFCMYAGKYIFTSDFFIIGVKNGVVVYDLFLIADIAKYYLFFSSLYNKTPSIYDFSSLINIDYNIIKNWNSGSIKNIEFNQAIKDLQKFYINIMNSNENYNIYIKKMLCCSGEVLTTLQASIFYKLHDSREESLKSALISKNNPVGLISIVNKEYKWNIETIKEETKARVLSLQELPQINQIIATNTNSNNCIVPKNN